MAAWQEPTFNFRLQQLLTDLGPPDQSAAIATVSDWTPETIVSRVAAVREAMAKELRATSAEAQEATAHDIGAISVGATVERGVRDPKQRRGTAEVLHLPGSTHSSQAAPIGDGSNNSSAEGADGHKGSTLLHRFGNKVWRHGPAKSPAEAEAGPSSSYQPTETHAAKSRGRRSTIGSAIYNAVPGKRSTSYSVDSSMAPMSAKAGAPSAAFDYDMPAPPSHSLSAIEPREAKPPLVEQITSGAGPYALEASSEAPHVLRAETSAASAAAAREANELRAQLDLMRQENERLRAAAEHASHKQKVAESALKRATVDAI